MSNPHFIYKKTFDIIENALFEIQNAFDIYSLYKDKNKIYLCGPNGFKGDKLDIFEFKGDSFKKKISLQNHKESITNCKYFINKEIIKEYLVSTDCGASSSNTIIFEILDEDNYKEILNIKNVDRIRYPFSLIFNYKNKSDNQLFFIHATSQVDSEIISEKNEIFKEIRFTQGKIFQYIVWENKIDYINYIIQCNTDYIYIYDIFNTNMNFIKIDNQEISGKNFSVHILYNNNSDILCIVNEKGNVILYDLLEKKISFVIMIKDIGIINICEFDKNFLIILSKNGCFYIFDYNNKKIIQKNCVKNLSKVKTIKLINSDLVGKYLLIGGFMTGLLLYKNKESVKIKSENII